MRPISLIISRRKYLASGCQALRSVSAAVDFWHIFKRTEDAGRQPDFWWGTQPRATDLGQHSKPPPTYAEKARSRDMLDGPEPPNCYPVSPVQLRDAWSLPAPREFPLSEKPYLRLTDVTASMHTRATIPPLLPGHIVMPLKCPLGPTEPALMALLMSSKFQMRSLP
jgi:hypothetical protein